MVLFAGHILTACLISTISMESMALLTPRTLINLRSSSGSSKSAFRSIHQPKVIMRSGESFKLYSSIINPPEPSPIKPGPLGFIKRMIMLTVVVIKLNSLKMALGVASAVGAVLNVFGGGPKNGSKKDKANANNKRGTKLIANLSALVKQRKFWFQMSIAFVTFGITRYMAFTKSLTTELSFTTFLSLLTVAPERVAGLRVTPSAFMFRLDGKSALTRMVTLDPAVMNTLLASGVDFAALPAPTNVLGLLWTFAYAAFLWNISSKMMQGPQDEGAGKRKDKAGELDAYGKLSFEDVAGQERAKLEVKEVCEMLQAPEKYLTVGARLPSGVLLVGPPGTGKERGKRGEQ